MSEFSSVLELARVVTEAANQLKQGDKAAEEAKRVLRRVDEVDALLGRLSQVVTAARNLATASGEESVSLTTLDDGRENFARNAERAAFYPSDQAFNGARGKIGDVTKRVSGGLEEAWSQWVAQQVGAVPRMRMSRLDPVDQLTVHSRWDSLVKTSKVTTPTVSDIISLKSDLDYLHDMLDPLPDLPAKIQEMWDRLGQRPTMMLADLSDEQIAALREAGVADQIEVRRRGV